MANSIDEKIGKLLAMTETHGEQLESLVKKVDTLATGGCSTAKENRERVKRLERLILVIVAVLSSVVGIEKLWELFSK
jgi:hypothetical protein